MVNQTPDQQTYEFDWQNPDYVKQQYQIGRVFSRTFLGVFKQWKPILLAFICTTICFSVFLAISMLFFGAGFTDSFGLDTSQSGSAGETISVIFLSMLMIFGFIFVMVVTDAAIFSHYRNQKTSIRYLMSKAFKKVVPLTFGLLLFVFASYIGLILFIVPGLFIYFGWGIFGPIYVNENKGLFESFGRSWELMKGYKRWFLLTSFLMSMILNVGFYVILLMVTIPLELWVQGAGTSDMVLTIMGFVLIVVFLLLMLVGITLQAAFVTANYLEVRELKEPFDEESMAKVFS